MLFDPLVGLVGSPLDVVTLGYLVVEHRYGVLPRVRANAAAASAAARAADGADGDRAEAETDADRADVRAILREGVGDD